jgi:threonine/homoserine/homoserine lactone efflux protein
MMTNVCQNILLGISLAVPLGPATIAIIRSGLKFGFLSALITALGIVTADTTYILLVYLGVSRFVTLPLVKVIIWTFGTFTLFYLGFQGLKELFRQTDLNQSAVQIERNFFLVGYVVNISNPIAIVWWLGVFGSILAASTENGSSTTALLYSLTIVIGIMSWHTFLSFLTHWGNKFFKESIIRYVSAIGGLILIGFGLRFGHNALTLLIQQNWF